MELYGFGGSHLWSIMKHLMLKTRLLRAAEKCHWIWHSQLAQEVNMILQRVPNWLASFQSLVKPEVFCSVFQHSQLVVLRDFKLYRGIGFIYGRWRRFRFQDLEVIFQWTWDLKAFLNYRRWLSFLLKFAFAKRQIGYMEEQEWFTRKPNLNLIYKNTQSDHKQGIQSSKQYSQI